MKREAGGRCRWRLVGQASRHYRFLLPYSLARMIPARFRCQGNHGSCSGLHAYRPSHFRLTCGSVRRRVGSGSKVRKCGMRNRDPFEHSRTSRSVNQDDSCSREFWSLPACRRGGVTTTSFHARRTGSWHALFVLSHSRRGTSRWTSMCSTIPPTGKRGTQSAPSDEPVADQYRLQLAPRPVIVHTNLLASQTQCRRHLLHAELSHLP